MPKWGIKNSQNKCRFFRCSVILCLSIINHHSRQGSVGCFVKEITANHLVHFSQGKALAFHQSDLHNTPYIKNIILVNLSGLSA